MIQTMIQQVRLFLLQVLHGVPAEEYGRMYDRFLDARDQAEHLRAGGVIVDVNSEGDRFPDEYVIDVGGDDVSGWVNEAWHDTSS